MNCSYIVLTTSLFLIWMTEGSTLQPCNDFAKQSGNMYKLYHKWCRWNSIPELNISQYVKKINIKTNALTELKAYEVANLPQLTHLILKMCNISTIHKDAFRNATKLQEINLSKNIIKSLPVGLFVDQTHCLKNLHLECNKIATILPLTFSNLKSMVLLNLNYNEGLVMEPHAFHQVVLQTLVISFCAIPYFENGSFYGLNFKPYPTPSKLEISHNDLSHLANLAFPGASTLAHLDVHNNKISIIHKSAFVALTSLIGLDIRNNHLTVLDCQVFSTLHNIQYINLQHNNLIDIIPECEANFVNSLKYLRLKHNNISSLSNAFAGRIMPWPNVANYVYCRYLIRFR